MAPPISALSIAHFVGLLGLKFVLARPSYAQEVLGFGSLLHVKVFWSKRLQQRADWMLSTRGTQVLVGGRYASLLKLKTLVGLRVQSVHVSYPRLSLVLVLERGVQVEVRPTPEDARSGVAYWVVRTPSRVEITAGPGPQWSRRRLPLFLDDEWRARHERAAKSARARTRSARR